MPDLKTLVRTTLTAALVAAAVPALADAIDGDWCEPTGDRQLHISGPDITTPSGTKTTGNYSRHAFSYVIPDGDPGAGGLVDMRLLNEHEVSISESGGDYVTWVRCEVNA